MTLEVKPLTGETWEALAELFREGGDPRWCWYQWLKSRQWMRPMLQWPPG